MSQRWNELGILLAADDLQLANGKVAIVVRMIVAYSEHFAIRLELVRGPAIKSDDDWYTEIDSTLDATNWVAPKPRLTSVESGERGFHLMAKTKEGSADVSPLSGYGDISHWVVEYAIRPVSFESDCVIQCVWRSMDVPVLEFAVAGHDLLRGASEAREIWPIT